MSHYRTLIGFVILALAIPGFSQEAKTKNAETKTPVVTKEEPRSDGLQKMMKTPF